jgi:hypothetical protein
LCCMSEHIGKFLYTCWKMLENLTA